VDYLYQLRFHVEKMGFNVVTAESQRDAEQLLSTMQPEFGNTRFDDGE
jgi:hypothetical protein